MTNNDYRLIIIHHTGPLKGDLYQSTVTAMPLISAPAAAVVDIYQKCFDGKHYIHVNVALISKFDLFGVKMGK